ncbi:MAG: hypothetical protein JWR21_3273 [Herminiimonas sp.]|nr:hypothetical protein [Herminiimonas sp.]
MNTEMQIKLVRAFAKANAIVDLDGLPMTADMQEMQGKIIVGEMSFDEAVQICIQRFSKKLV